MPQYSATRRHALEKLQRLGGIVIPTICTPEELLEGGDENG
jgi:hypothetical protein